tara:strand:+ start:1384 stop:1932 length:549 start_codon:yes stop_codon:yes gene_type:complete
MKNLKKQINKILVNFVEQQNAKQIKNGEKKVEAESCWELNGESSIVRLSHLIAVKTIANLDHPTDSKRFDIELVSDYKANYFYKGTKNLVSKEDFDKWLNEFVLVPAKPSKLSWDVNNDSQFLINDDGDNVFIHLQGSAADLYNSDSEFYHAPFQLALDKHLEDAGINFDPYSPSTLQVEAR